MKPIDLYHGSKIILEHPYPCGGKPYNDYGYGFYCTRDLELANEWSCTEGGGGFANHYLLNMDGLRVLHLNTCQYHILNWLAILLQNRSFSVPEGIMSQAKTYLLDTFLPPYTDYDLIVGYRADDSYFKFSRAFLAGSISLEHLKQAMNLGKLGEQTVLKSENAFAQLQFVDALPADYNVYFVRRQARDRRADEDYRNLASGPRVLEGTYILDILRQGWKNDDARLR